MHRDKNENRFSPRIQALLAASGSLLFGYHLSQISGVTSGLKAYFVDPFELSDNQSQLFIGFLVSVALLGSVFGSLFAGYLANKYGRKPVLLFITIIFFITSFISAFPGFSYWNDVSENWFPLAVFVFSRVLSGIALGIVSAVVPLFISEISPIEKRGSFIAYSQMGIVLGILLAYLVNYWIVNLGDQHFLLTVGWRQMLMAEAFFAVIVFIAFLFLKESPVYLNYKPSHTPTQKSSFKAIKITKYGRKVLILGIGIAAFQPFCGINVIFFYAPSIFSISQTNVSDTFFQTLLLGGLNLIGTLIALRLVDRIGRKKIYFLGSIGMGLCMIFLGLSFYLDQQSLWSLGLMLLFVLIYALSWGPITWVLASEVFPEAIRAKALSIGVAGQWLMNYIFTWFFPILVNSPLLSRSFHHAFPFWLYALMILIPTYLIWKLSPETLGKTNKQIEAFWKKEA